MTAATGVGIWLGITSGSLAIIHVLNPHLAIAGVGCMSSMLFFVSTLEKPKPKPKKEKAHETREPLESPERKWVRRDLEG